MYIVILEGLIGKMDESQVVNYLRLRYCKEHCSCNPEVTSFEIKHYLEEMTNQLTI
jgi:hypothetical protein